MRIKFTATILFLISVLTAFSNESVPGKDTDVTDKVVSTTNPTEPSLYSSDWESVSGWASQKIGETITFQYSRSTPELNNTTLKNGVVVVFARNLWADVPAFVELGAPDKPVKMPFYFLPDFDKPDYSELWSYSTKENKINLILEIKGATKPWKPGNQVQFRYIVIPEDMLKAKGMNVQTVRRMSYSDIMQMFATK